MYNYLDIIKYYRFFFIGVGLFLLSALLLALSHIFDLLWLNGLGLGILIIALPFAMLGYLKMLLERVKKFFER